MQEGVRQVSVLQALIVLVVAAALLCFGHWLLSAGAVGVALAYQISRWDAANGAGARR
jgi:hypothetical protein